MPAGIEEKECPACEDGRRANYVKNEQTGEWTETGSRVCELCGGSGRVKAATGAAARKIMKTAEKKNFRQD